MIKDPSSSAIPEPFIYPEKVPFKWETDDVLLPGPGFITDFVAALRGVEVPTIFCMWTALWVLSTASCRLVSIDWLPDSPLFPNLYIFLVAPPGRCHKGTALSFGRKVLRGISEMFDRKTLLDEFLKYMTEFNWMTSKTTPDVLYELLTPQEKQIKGSDSEAPASKGSQIVGCIAELGTFLNRKKYMTGIIETLTDLYDCLDFDVIHTIGRGSLQLRDIFVTLIGGVTPTGLKSSLPYEAFGEGFVSRVSIVYKEQTERSFARPIVFDGFPTLRDLKERLVWLMRNKLGTYSFTKEASDWYDAWYLKWKDELDKDPRYRERVDESRFDVNLQRIATLLSFSRYSTDLIVTKEDCLDAEKILKATIKSSRFAAAEAGIAPTEFQTEYRRVEEFLRRILRTNRVQLTRNMSSKGISMKTVREILQQLLIEGRLIVRSADGSVQPNIAWSKNEIYEWQGD